MDKSPHRPILIVIAGPNGSGKTSVTSKLLKHEWVENSEYINPDNVAMELYGDWNSKDAGRPFNPVLSSRHSNLLETNNVSLGLTLVNNVCTTLSHKYMYGQNVVFAEFKGGE